MWGDPFSKLEIIREKKRNEWSVVWKNMLPNDTIKIQLRKGREKKSHIVVETSMLKTWNSRGTFSKRVLHEMSSFSCNECSFPDRVPGKGNAIKRWWPSAVHPVISWHRFIRARYSPPRADVSPHRSEIQWADTREIPAGVAPWTQRFASASLQPA